MNRILQGWTLALMALVTLPPALAQTATKKLVRIHTSGPADLGVDNTMLCQGQVQMSHRQQS